jgi:hypothetical protein
MTEPARHAPEPFVASGDVPKLLSAFVRNPTMSRAEFDALAGDMTEADREKFWKQAQDLRAPG